MKQAALTVAFALALAAPAAEAAPKRTSESIQHGTAQVLHGVGCSTATVSVEAHGDVLRTKPAVGGSVGIDAEVQAVEIEPGRVTWTVGPDQESCTLNDEIDGAGQWTWRTYGDATWGVQYSARRYAIRASTTNGIRSIAGFKVRPRGRSYAPSLWRARRALGRPTAVRAGRGAYNDACWATWKHLGLRATFSNFGLGGPCRRGSLQLARIDGPAAAKWVAAIGRSPGIGVGTSLGYLVAGDIGAADPFDRRLRTLADRYLPYGDGGFQPTVSTIFTGAGSLRPTNTVRGFDLYIGAAGD